MGYSYTTEKAITYNGSPSLPSAEAYTTLIITFSAYPSHLLTAGIQKPTMKHLYFYGDLYSPS